MSPRIQPTPWEGPKRFPLRIVCLELETRALFSRAIPKRLQKPHEWEYPSQDWGPVTGSAALPGARLDAEAACVCLLPLMRTGSALTFLKSPQADIQNKSD